MNPFRQVLYWAATVALVYICCSYFAYALLHPSLTQTEVFLDFWKVVTWK